MTTFAETEKKPLLSKTQTGIEGLDEITEGGFPAGRPTLVCGSAGCGKTLMATQFLVRGITEYDEPGVFMSFEESIRDLSQNVQSLGFDIEKLKASGKLKIDYVRVEKSEIDETGEYDLEGLFIRLSYAIDSIGAKRVVLDTIESLFAGIENTALLRSEIRRLFNWLKNKGVTAVITGERGENSFTRQGLEEYVSDCVILLDLRVIDQIATRRLRIVKYRGSTHGTNEYPFTIDENGISVLPITSLKLDYETSLEIISTGLPALDKLFDRGGLYKGNSTLITGVAGTAKTIISTYFAVSCCRRGDRVLYFAFEESPSQMVRNMASIGLDLQKYIDNGLLLIHASRPTLQGLESHLLTLYKYINDFKPQTVVVDPISSLISVGSGSEVRAMLVRLMDMLKVNQINTFLTALTHSYQNLFTTLAEDAVSSLADTWIKLGHEKTGTNRFRELYVVKSRGMGHSGLVWNFMITKDGFRLLPASPDGLTGKTGNALPGKLPVKSKPAKSKSKTNKGRPGKK